MPKTGDSQANQPLSSVRDVLVDVAASERSVPPPHVPEVEVHRSVAHIAQP